MPALDPKRIRLETPTKVCASPSATHCIVMSRDRLAAVSRARAFGDLAGGEARIVEKAVDVSGRGPVIDDRAPDRRHAGDHGDRGRRAAADLPPFDDPP